MGLHFVNNLCRTGLILQNPPPSQSPHDATDREAQDQDLTPVRSLLRRCPFWSEASGAAGNPCDRAHLSEPDYT